MGRPDALRNYSVRSMPRTAPVVPHRWSLVLPRRTGNHLKMQSAHIPNAFSRAFKRRSARVQLKILISIVIGDDSVLDAETTTVSKHGARIRVTSTRGRLTHGERLRVALRRGKNPLAARVVWLDKRSAAHFGIELDEDPGNFWGV